MRKTLLIFFITIFCYAPAIASANSVLDKMETAILGMTYSDQDEKSRIERLEKNIYGQTQQGNLNARKNKLSKDLLVETFDKLSTSPEYEYEYEPEISDNTVDYPIINELEKKIFNTEFKNKDIKLRLSNLEQSVFKKTYTQDDLSTRTERLKGAVTINKAPKVFDSLEEELQDINSRYNDYVSQSPINPQDIYRKYDSFMEQDDSISKIKTPQKYDKNVVKILNALEKKVFRKTFANLSEDERVEQLEENMFNTSFPQESIEARLERLALAYQASKSATKYDGNKFARGFSTAMQVGMYLLMILAMVL